jgi:hypothetical protein
MSYEGLREQVARALDPEAFDDAQPKSKQPAALVQWAARRHIAYEYADRLLTLITEAVDLCWKATPYGKTADGDVHTYIVPKGVVHRLVGALQGAGISASLRAFTQQEGVELLAHRALAQHAPGEFCAECPERS